MGLIPKEESNKFYTLSPKVLDEIIDYIEDTSQIIEGDRGSCKSLKKLIEDNDMHEVYYELISLRNRV